MKRMILAMAVMSIAIALHAQKFGHVTSELLVQAMPEYDSAIANVQELQKHYTDEIERIQVEINKKIEEFNQSESTMSNLIKEAKASEIQELQMRLQNFSQTAQQDLQQKNMVLMQPVMEKARKAIEEVAMEHGLIYVFDLSTGNPIYTSEESLDMDPLVKARLGIQ
ncbi:MAG: OmpH family outer membrane protein [Bacteroidales bacterium]|nr:OmpH family outer membrane protein [Bacteroidales bacterium]